MGSLAYAAGGGLAGLGQGMAQVGREAHEEQMLQKQNDLATAREETMTRLRDSLEKENIQNQQAFQSKAAGATHQFELGKEQQRQEFETGKAKTHEEAATGRAEILAGARKYAADRSVDRAAAGKKPAAEWTRSNLSEQGSIGTGPDGKAAILPGRSYSLLRHNPTGQGFVEVGDKLLPYDASATQFPDSKSVRNAPAADIADLMQHPERGMAFFRAYKYLPRDWMSKNAEMKQQGEGNLPKFVGKGATVTASNNFGGGGEPEPTDHEDAADEQTAEGPQDPYGQDGAPTSQPSDNQPAQ